MQPTAVSGVLARAVEAGEPPDGQDGAAAATLWRLAGAGRQLDADLLRLGPGAVAREPAETRADVLLCVTGGAGRLESDAGEQELLPGCVAWLPRGTGGTVAAGPSGLVCLAVRGRPGPAPRPGAEPEGGEAACLLNRVCTECGRLSEERGAQYCSRCGEQLPTD